MADTSLNAREYPWYEWVSGNLIEQGDLLLDFGIIVMDQAVQAGARTTEARGEIRDVVVMSQTCDIQHDKVRNLVLCPCYDLRVFAKESKRWGLKECEGLCRGNLPGYHLLSDCGTAPRTLPLQVVDFHEILSAPLAVVRQFAAGVRDGRPRLCPPYREHLAQAFARFFMRVGLPAEVSKDRLLAATS